MRFLYRLLFAVAVVTLLSGSALAQCRTVGANFATYSTGYAQTYAVPAVLTPAIIAPTFLYAVPSTPTTLVVQQPAVFATAFVAQTQVLAPQYQTVPVQPQVQTAPAVPVPQVPVQPVPQPIPPSVGVVPALPVVVTPAVVAQTFVSRASYFGTTAVVPNVVVTQPLFIANHVGFANRGLFGTNIGVATRVNGVVQPRVVRTVNVQRTRIR
jgi:hypothetical protein